MSKKPDSTLYLVGKYIGLASLLPSGAVAGYLIGLFADHYFHRDWLRAAGILLGLAGALFKIVQELLRESHRQE